MRIGEGRFRSDSHESVTPMALAVLSLVTVLPLWLLSLVAPSLRGFWEWVLMMYALGGRCLAAAP